MKTIVCYGDSNTWGLIPTDDEEDAEGLAKRYAEDVRWTGALARMLGAEYRVIEEGLNGRTTVFNDVFGRYRNGAKYLGACLTTQKPMDLLIFMLGSNDVKKHYVASSAAISRGMEKLIRIAKGGAFGTNGGSPQILVVSPAHIGEAAFTSRLRADFDNSSIQKSRELAALLFDVARRQDCYYMNAAVYAKASTVDGLHLDAENHRKLAEAMYTKITEILSPYEC